MADKPNLEIKFRKIPSLDLKYEISEDGQTIRNSKSKKTVGIAENLNLFKAGHNIYPITTRTVFIDGETHLVNSLWYECWGRKAVRVHVKAKNGIYFASPTITYTAKILHLISGMNEDTIKEKLKQHRKYICGYEIDYSELDCRDWTHKP